MMMSIFPDWRKGMRLPEVTATSSTWFASLKSAWAKRWATSTSKPTFLPLASIVPKGGKSVFTPAMSFPRFFTTSSVDCASAGPGPPSSRASPTATAAASPRRVRSMSGTSSDGRWWSITRPRRAGATLRGSGVASRAPPGRARRRVEVRGGLGARGEQVGKPAGRRRVRETRDLARHPRGMGGAAHPRAPLLERPIRGTGLEAVGGERLELLPHPLRRHGRAAEHRDGAAAPKGPAPARGDERVDREHADRVHGDAEAVGDELGNRRRVALALRRKARHATHRPVRAHRHGRGLDAGNVAHPPPAEHGGAHAGVLRVARDADADETARGTRRRLVAAEPVVVHRGEDLLERLGEVAAVVRHPARRDEGIRLAQIGRAHV